MENPASSKTIEAQRALLRRFEPVARFTRGEKFFPMDVQPYVEQSSLWVYRPGQEPRCLVPQGELTLERLAQVPPLGHDALYYLQFIEPLNVAELAAYKLQRGLSRRDPQDTFHAGSGRLARVGYGSRFFDALFSLTLFTRGRVPGDTAAAAALMYEKLQEQEECYRYYGRVVRIGGWTVLQYWFFYPFNDWRTGFYGGNDHEADWEMVCIYLSETAEEGWRPEWVAYASHEHSGDDLRRRWDDPELEKVGDHPVIYVGAGSHASYFTAGEYLTEIELPFLAPFVDLLESISGWFRRSFSRERVGRARPGRSNAFSFLRLPFVDYARGDGFALGPGERRGWDEPELLDPLPDWAAHYRGLWGLFARDPVSGENAPAGPVYRRDGLERRSWYDPVGWAGLDKVPPRSEALQRVLARRAEVEVGLQKLDQEIGQMTDRMEDLGLDVLAMRDVPHLRDHYAQQDQELSVLAEEIRERQVQRHAQKALAGALDRLADQLREGEWGHPRRHLVRAHTPLDPEDLRLNRIAEIWAAVSIGLVLLGFVFIALFFRDYLIFGLASLISLIVFMEAGFRRRLTRLINSLTVGLTVVASLLLIFDLFWDLVVVLAIVAGAYIMWENVRELWA